MLFTSRNQWRLGEDACWLIVMVAYLEESIQHKDFVIKWDKLIKAFGSNRYHDETGELMVSVYDRFNAAMNKAVEHGWLDYELCTESETARFTARIPGETVSQSIEAVEGKDDPGLTQSNLLARSMTHFGVARTLGTGGCMMVLALARSEEILATSPIRYSSGSMTLHCGFRSSAGFYKARKIATEEGWIEYVKGSGGRSPEYKVTMPVALKRALGLTE